MAKVNLDKQMPKLKNTFKRYETNTYLPYASSHTGTLTMFLNLSLKPS